MALSLLEFIFTWFACSEKEGGEGKRRYMKKKTKRDSVSSGAQCLRKMIFDIYALVAERFFLCIRRVLGRGARLSTCTLFMMLTALTIQLFEAKKCFVAL